MCMAIHLMEFVMTRRSGNLLLASVALLIGIAAFVFFFIIQTYHLETVQEGVLYRDGNRGMREFQNTIEQVRPKTVVSLLDDDEMADPENIMFRDEVELLEAENIRLVRIPVKLGGWPTEADIHTFLALVQNPDNQPVLIHCAQGVRRTGMMVAAYQETVQKMSDAHAGFRIERFGRKDNSDTMADVTRFIHSYDGQTGQIKESLMPTTQPVAERPVAMTNE